MDHRLLVTSGNGDADSSPPRTVEAPLSEPGCCPEFKGPRSHPSLVCISDNMCFCKPGATFAVLYPHGLGRWDSLTASELIQAHQGWSGSAEFWHCHGVAWRSFPAGVQVSPDQLSWVGTGALLLLSKDRAFRAISPPTGSGLAQM